MADRNTDSGSPERVALELTKWIVDEEQHATNSSGVAQPREHLLDLYAKCLHATKGFRPVKP